MTDTPGLLERPLSERNAMERLTLACLNHLPSAVLFVLDLTAQCGTSVQDQLTIRSLPSASTLADSAVYPFIYLIMPVFTLKYMCLFIHLLTHSLYHSFAQCASICLSFYPSVPPSIRLSIHPLTYPSI